MVRRERSAEIFIDHSQFICVSNLHACASMRVQALNVPLISQDYFLGHSQVLFSSTLLYSLVIPPSSALD